MQAIADFLTELTIANELLAPDFLKVSRDDMVRVGKGSWEQEHYDDVLKTLQAKFPDLRLMWGGKDDDFLYLESIKLMTSKNS